MKESYYYIKKDDRSVICTLCPHSCHLKEGEIGICLGRQNIEGSLIAFNYGRVTAFAVDPIEKKPLYHFNPGTEIASVSQIGCNMRCPFCQNYEISQMEAPYQNIDIEAMDNIIKKQKFSQIAFTYTEPLMWYEYIIDYSLKDKDSYKVIVSNGMINEKPLNRLAPFISAANIDLKSYNPDYYKNVLKGDLETVKRTIKILYESKVHIEITHLLIPGVNDIDTEFKSIVEFIKNISPLIPFHISRYFPAYKSNIFSTPISTISKFLKYAKENLPYVYAGNADILGFSDTLCPDCSSVLIERNGYRIKTLGLESSSCKKCGRPFDGSVYEE